MYDQQRLVGAIYQHDIDAESGDALIGYHLFHTADRGKGIGTRMLGILQKYVVNETAIKRLVIITGRDNGASRGIALACGFEDMGGAWEDPKNLVVYAWSVTRL
ncbi:MAG: GNAT family protein [Chloroflexi bacterium]|nr:GNAT family protein [Chloroflexota bacterium]